MLGKLFQLLFLKCMKVSTSHSSAITIRKRQTKVYRYSTQRCQITLGNYAKVNQGSYESDLSIWNNRDITIEGKSPLFSRKWTENGIYYIQDISNNGKFLTFGELNRRYNMPVSENPCNYSAEPQIQGVFYDLTVLFWIIPTFLTFPLKNRFSS